MVLERGADRVGVVLWNFPTTVGTSSSRRTSDHVLWENLDKSQFRCQRPILFT